MTLAAELAAEQGLGGWRQHEHLLKNIRQLVRAIGRVSRAKGQGKDRLKPGYQKLLELAKDLLERGRQLAAGLGSFARTLSVSLDQREKRAPHRHAEEAAVALSS